MKITTINLGLEEHIDYKPEKSFYVLMPAYNEADHDYFVDTILEATELNGLEKVIVINDGSTDNTAKRVLSLKEKNSLIDLVDCKENLGKEGAIKKGLIRLLSYKNFNPDSWIAMIDSDGQHKIKDLSRMFCAAESTNAGVVGGYRPLKDMPPNRRFGNWGAAAILRILGDFPIKDPLFGQKVFHAKYAPKLAQDLTSNGGYRVELSLIKYLAKYGADFYEIPVKAEYKECSGKSGMGAKNLNKFIKNVIYTCTTGTRIRNLIRLSKI